MNFGFCIYLFFFKYANVSERLIRWRLGNPCPEFPELSEVSPKVSMLLFSPGSVIDSRKCQNAETKPILTFNMDHGES